MGYPKFKYHRTKEAKVVKNEDEERALGRGWANSPAEFKKKCERETTSKVKDKGKSQFEDDDSKGSD